ncbi:cell wall hydrolase [Sphingomonas lycopersici]|uniref:Cell wall hydrolase n=1 Tax=Sphingomonas lycopersici TaxID=2951807 RepID=A0AA41ZBJ0_9SPHN|nr:cell wall hydrolase [Sphingomonas lycopersici]MCW6536573.1 cell wall hydrolase [Sphingomonas lycopersici]
MTAMHHSEIRALRAARHRAWPRVALIVVSLTAAAGVALSLLPPEPAPPAPRVPITAPPETGLPAFASPARGTTGTIALPPVPRGASAVGDATVTAAAPFSTRLASTIDRARALECLSAAVYYEAGAESDAGQRAVAQVVVNRVRHPAFPPTVCGVVYQGAARGSGCQFSFACDGAAARIPSRDGWARAARNAAAILAGQVFAPVGLATHYHTYAVTPAWNRTLVMTDVVGAHFFHRWKGYWGTAAAFGRAYRGGEPQPTLPAPPPVVPAPLPVPVAVTPTQPAHAESGIALRDAAPDNLPRQPQILDRWKDSGKPLR